MVGTLAFMSPEQIRGEPAGPASDVFSLGSVLGFAATGRPPFGDDSAVSIMFRVVSQPPDLAGVADAEMRELIAGCLAKSAGDRPPVRVILAALSSVVPVSAAARALVAAPPPAAGNDLPAQTRAPARTETGPDRESAAFPAARGPGPPRTGVARSGAPPAEPAGRRRAAAIAVAAAIVAALAAVLPFVLAAGRPPAAAGHRPGREPSMSSPATTPGHSSVSPVVAKSRRPPGPTASTASAASPSVASPSVASPAIAVPDPGSAQQIAYDLLPSFGWSTGTYFGCLDNLWNEASGWRYNAEAPSGAYGIPQALPGSKMASAGPDWQTNPRTQIKWGLGYIKAIYGTPCGAWSFMQANGYY